MSFRIPDNLSLPIMASLLLHLLPAFLLYRYDFSRHELPENMPETEQAAFRVQLFPRLPVPETMVMETQTPQEQPLEAQPPEPESQPPAPAETVVVEQPVTAASAETEVAEQPSVPSAPRPTLNMGEAVRQALEQASTGSGTMDCTPTQRQNALLDCDQNEDGAAAVQDTGLRTQVYDDFNPVRTQLPAFAADDFSSGAASQERIRSQIRSGDRTSQMIDRVMNPR